MRIDYSKPGRDVAIESLKQLETDTGTRELQFRVSSSLDHAELRVVCIVCAGTLAAGEIFRHRQIDYLICSSCGHIQSRARPPQGYPRTSGGPEFSQVYPTLERHEFESRRDRIYKPKLDWALSCHSDLGLTRDTLLRYRWVEFGCGAGYFLSALKDAGATDYSGIDNDSQLLEAAVSMVGAEHARHYSGTLADAAANFDADVYVAFFVLEHLEETHRFFENMRRCRPGTIFLFSVPTFGLSTVLESAFDVHSARSLDGVFHTQMFTEQSIHHCLNFAGFEIVGQWMFGQDSIDFRRLLLVSLRAKYGNVLYQTVSDKLARIQDPLQEVLDRNKFADSRHLIAIKK